MKIIMTLLVRDEEDILRENILFHLEQGVDFFIATDNLSTDSSLEILKEFEAKGLLYLIEEKNDTYSQSIWVTRMAQMAAKEFGATWVINSDADEFWWSDEQNLKKSLDKVPTKFAVLKVPRHNFIPKHKVPPPIFENMVTRYVQSKNALGQPLPHKVCHRGLENVTIEQGNHNLSYPTNLHIFPGSYLEIFHFPIRTYAQFENKIIKGGAAYERNQTLSPIVGETWRKLYIEWKNGNLFEHFHNQTLTDQEVIQGVADKMLVNDTRLRDFMRSRKII